MNKENMITENFESMEVTPGEPSPHGTMHPIHLPMRHNPKLQALVERINADADLYALWECANVNAVTRLGMSDHGPVHVRLIANIALRLLRLPEAWWVPAVGAVALGEEAF